DQLRRLSDRTDLNRLIGHILGFIGEDRAVAARGTEAGIPDNPEFRKTVRAFQRLLPSTGYNWAEISRPLERRLGRISQLYKQWLTLTPTVDDLIQAGSDKTFVEYIDYKNTRTGLDHYAVFTVTTGTSAADIHFFDLGPAASIDQHIVALRRALLQRAPIEKSRQQLAEALIKPLSIKFEETGEVVISPVASLNSLPFSLLVQTGSSEATAISYSDSWSILIQTFSHRSHLNPPVTTTPGIILTDPDYGGDLKKVSADLDIAGQERQGSDAWPRFFAPLAYTAQEGKTIERLSPDKVILLSGNKASEFALFERNNPKFIHIASHGYFLSDDWQRRDQWPLRRRGDRGLAGVPNILPRLNSGLALAGANQLIAGTQVKAFQPDGLFTASDAASLNLLGTELVVLSACNTGLGDVGDQADRISVGDGVTNLRSAFRQAGARHVIMSLWPVADKTTWWLMEAFYQSWFSGTPPKKALSQAKTRLRKRLRENGMSDHPYYWAGFVI
ncbi:MAG TPA: CHAT domain-containing protein, partial [Gammaproteobacteria bacterium]|nr:CHAT domain-containing protein [Gammaproteobacteria bacterium]